MAKSTTTAPKASAKATKAPAAKSAASGGDHDTANDKAKAGDAVTTTEGRANAAARDQAQPLETAGERKGNDAAAEAATASSHRNTTEGVEVGEGETIQHKPSIREALGGKDENLSDIGTGEVAEAAPIIRGAVMQAMKNDREVKQGDTVILHTRSLLNGKLENAGAMLKANQDGTIAVRIPLQTGGYRDFSPVYNGPQNGEDWFSVAEDSGALDDVRKTE